MSLQQPDLFSAQPAPRRRHRPVRATSVAAYADGRARFTGRKAEVLRWLAHYINRYQVNPTSAELARCDSVDLISGNDEWMSQATIFASDMTLLLYIRRGLSDLQTSGVVEAVPQGERKCQVSGRVCCTWRVIPVGRT